MSHLNNRYHELIALRIEGLRKYGASSIADMHVAPSQISFPRLALNAATMPSVRFGPLSIVDNPPIVVHAERAIMSVAPGAVAEIGPGKGSLAKHLASRFGPRITKYYGVELDPIVDAPYVLIETLKAVPDVVGTIIASEVIEHVAPDVMYDEFLLPAAKCLSPDGSLVIGTPNALAAGAIFRDFTHVQGYAWYDIYAICRLLFGEVDIVRTTYIQSFGRIFNFVPKRIISPAIELDWCDGIVCVARKPIR